MAQRTEVLLTCDVHDGNAGAVETVLYTVDGRTYDCDLCDGHLAEFRDAMEIWSSYSRATGRGRARPTTGRAGPQSRRAALEVVLAIRPLRRFASGHVRRP